MLRPYRGKSDVSTVVLVQWLTAARRPLVSKWTCPYSLALLRTASTRRSELTCPGCKPEMYLHQIQVAQVHRIWFLGGVLPCQSPPSCEKPCPVAPKCSPKHGNTLPQKTGTLSPFTRKLGTRSPSTRKLGTCSPFPRKNTNALPVPRENGNTLPVSAEIGNASPNLGNSPLSSSPGAGFVQNTWHRSISCDLEGSGMFRGFWNCRCFCRFKG